MAYSKFYSAVDPSPVTLQEFKQFVRQDGSYDDALLSAMLESAVTAVEEYVQQSLPLQNRIMELDAFPAGGVRLDMGPVVSVEEVRYVDPEGAEVELPPESYTLQGETLHPADQWPAGVAVQVVYTAGLTNPSASPPVELPSRYRVSVMMLAQVMYDRPPNADALERAAYRQLDTARLGQGV